MLHNPIGNIMPITVRVISKMPANLTIYGQYSPCIVNHSQLSRGTDANINNFDDLKGKRINIGNPGSGHRATMETIMGAKGWSKDIFKRVTELKAVEQGAALCDNKN